MCAARPALIEKLKSKTQQKGHLLTHAYVRTSFKHVGASPVIRPGGSAGTWETGRNETRFLHRRP